MVNKFVGLKVLILPLSSAAVIMIAVLFIKPAYSDVNKLKKVIGEDNIQLEQLKEQSTKMKEMESSLSSMEEKPMVMSALPEQDETDKYLAEFYGRVSRSGVLLKSFKLNELNASLPGCGGVSGVPLQSPGAGNTPITAGSGLAGAENSAAISQPVGTATAASQSSCLKTIGVDVTVSGSWDQVLSFLKYIEDTSRVANIDKVDLDPGQAGSDQGSGDIISAKVVLNIFSKPKSENANISQVNNLTSGDGLNKNILRKVEGAIYGTFDYNYDTEKTAGKNIFK
jgi:Tfp pilus assembly protein PilO